MKKQGIIIIAILICGCSLMADETKTIPYAVPDFPAFTIINANQDKSLSPNSLQELAINIANGYINNNGTIPIGTAIELSPAKLINPKYNVSNVVKSPVMYSTNLSFATTSNNDTYYAAMGLRTTLLDNSIDKIANFDFNKVLDFVEEQSGLSTEEAGIKWYNMSSIEQNKFLKSLMANKYWNIARLELAGAISGSAQDSLFHNLQFSAFQGWIVYSQNIETKMQLVISPSITIADENKQGSVPLKFNYGSNKGKISLLGQLNRDFDENINKLTSSLGIQYMFSNVIGFNYDFGLSWDSNDGKSNIQSQLQLKYSIQN